MQTDSTREDSTREDYTNVHSNNISLEEAQNTIVKLTHLLERNKEHSTYIEEKTLIRFM
jgi:hypothetical protein